MIDAATEPAWAPAKLDFDKVRHMTARDVGIRFAFGFTVSVLAGIVVKTAGPTFGGIFLAFPAILPATTTLIERKSGLAQASADVRGATVGALGMISFAWVAWKLLPSTEPALALGAALGSWLVTVVVVYSAMRAVVHLLGENHYLPEIPTTEAADVLEELRKRSLTIATAESCTGGLVASFFSSVPEASQVFRGAVVAYDADVKALELNVAADLLQREGAVSAPVAAIMSSSVRGNLGADIGLAIVGNTGTASDGKPAGFTYIAASSAAATVTRRYTDNYGPGRNDERAIRMAFRLVTDLLQGRIDDPHNVQPSEVGARGRRARRGRQ